MKAFLETTQWRDTAGLCNHVYWMNDSRTKIYAYARWGNPRDTQQFKVPIAIDARGRKFEAVRHDIYGWQDPDQEPEEKQFQVTGSRGDQYTVTETQGRWACTCSGFQFRNSCRHITQVQGADHAQLV